MTELQTKLQELRELVETKTVACPESWGVMDIKDGARHQVDCPGGCQGTGRIPDPTYAPLLEVMRAECQGLHYQVSPPYNALGCPYCGGTGYIALSWDGLPKGALAGALKLATLGIRRTTYIRSNSWHLPPGGTFRNVDWYAKEVDLNAVEDVIETLKEGIE